MIHPNARAGILAASVLACTAAWLGPAAKDAAVLGRLGYAQLLVAIGTSALLLSLAIALLGPAGARRTNSFKILAVWLGTGLVLLGWESYALFWPTRHLMDNPWYISTHAALGADRELRFVRPPGIEWTGRSRGDIAMLAGVSDSDARIVTFATDYQGFRNSRDLREAEVVFIGDSFTEAGNVPEAETFVQVVGRARGVVVRNLGVAGYTTAPELIVLKKRALNNYPKAVVWQIAESNDLTEAVVFAEWQLAGRPDYRTDQPGQPSRREAWAMRSPSHQLFERLRKHLHWPLAGRFIDESGRRRDVRFLPVLPGAEHSPKGHAGWKLMDAALRDGAAALEERGIQLVVVLIPMKLRVMADHIAFGPVGVAGAQRARRPAKGLVDWSLPRDATMAHALRRLCDELGAAFIDATDRLRDETAAGRLMYLPLDTHLSSAGHAAVGQLIAESLEAGSAR